MPSFVLLLFIVLLAVGLGCSSTSTPAETDSDGQILSDAPDAVDANPLPDTTPPPGECLPELDYFQCAVWDPFMDTTCFACHQPDRVGSVGSDLDLVPADPDQL